MNFDSFHWLSHRGRFCFKSRNKFYSGEICCLLLTQSTNFTHSVIPSSIDTTTALPYLTNWKLPRKILLGIYLFSTSKNTLKKITRKLKRKAHRHRSIESKREKMKNPLYRAYSKGIPLKLFLDQIPGRFRYNSQLSHSVLHKKLYCGIFPRG